METLIALLVAAGVALAADKARRLPASYYARRTRQAFEPHTVEDLPLGRGLLRALAPLARYTPAGWLRAVGRQLYWAQLGGGWQGWSLPEVAALHIACGLAGLAAGLLLAPGDLAMLLALAALAPFLLNLLGLRSPARKVHRQVQAELPELVALLAAEVAAQTTLEQALARLSRGNGLGAAWLRRALAGAVGEALFTPNVAHWDRHGQTGALLREATASGDDDLIALAINLDKIHQRGTGAQELLAQTARASAARYIAGANLRAEKVGSEIILPMVVFFFLPYVAVLLLVLGAPLLTGVVMP
jgi:Flp pilus assembly protein TadB